MVLIFHLVKLFTSSASTTNPMLGTIACSSGASGNRLYHTHKLSADSVSLSVLSIRQAYAAQKYKEIQLANDVDFASQIEAHFGVKPKHADDTSYFIGGSSSMIDINPIVNQNLSGDGQATFKASPIGNGSSKIKFTADTYGVVMGIYRCTPVLDYAHIGIDRTFVRLTHPISLSLKWIVSVCSRTIFLRFKHLF